MTDESETNQLLREIRDLLASQESKYQQHIADSKALYAEQLAVTEQARKKSFWRILIVLIVFLSSLAALTFYR